jgi:hypothetical protein
MKRKTTTKERKTYFVFLCQHFILTWVKVHHSRSENTTNNCIWDPTPHIHILHAYYFPKAEKVEDVFCMIRTT